MASTVRRARSSWRRATYVHRTTLSAALLAAAVAVGLQTLAPPAPPTHQVLVAAKDLPAGHRLVDDDLMQVAWPTSVAPPHPLSLDQARGAALSVPIAAGEPLTTARVRGAGLLAGLPSTYGSMTVSVSGPVDGLVHPGDRIDLIASWSNGLDVASPGPSLDTDVVNGAEVVARDVLVLASGTAGTSQNETGLLANSGSTGQGDSLTPYDGDNSLVVAVTTATALRIQANTEGRSLSVIVRPFT